MEFGFPFQKPCRVETRRLLLVIGIITSAAFAIQFFLSPYENVFLSIFPANNVPVLNETSYYRTGDLSPESVMVSSLFPPSYPSTIGNSSLVNGVVNNTEIGEQPNEETDGDDGQKADFMSPVLTLPPVGSPISLSNSKEFVANFSTSEASEMGKQTNNETNGNDGEETDYLAFPPVESPISLSIEQLGADFNTSGTSEMGKQTNNGTNGHDGEKTDYMSPQLTLPPVGSPIGLSNPKELDPNISTLVESVNSKRSSVDKQAPGKLSKEEKPGSLHTAPATSNNSTMKSNYVNKARNLRPPRKITSISQMNLLLLKSRASSHSMKPKWSSEPDLEIMSAKSQIENATIIEKDRDLYAPLYRNLSAFKRSYELMEHTLKVYIYEEGAKPIFHDPILEGIYASEGWFMKQMEESQQFAVRDPRKAHLFYLPFSSQHLRYTLYVPNSHSKKNLIKYLKDYMDVVTAKYPFWNRTGGADHFLAACHDWAPSITKRLMSQCIRALCNSDVMDGFKIGKDVSLPETFVRSKDNPLLDRGGKPPSERRTLAFFAGSMHGYLRPILLKYWENKDPDMKIYGKMNKSLKRQMNAYVQHMKESKYCICAKGYEVNSPRVVEAIFYECVPVIISDNYVPPFFEVLDWESFAVFVREKDIPNLKEIILSIPEEKYIEMQKRVKKVQKHFLWHTKPVKYDIFHMTLHSIWYNRVFQFEPR